MAHSSSASRSSMWTCARASLTAVLAARRARSASFSAASAAATRFLAVEMWVSWLLFIPNIPRPRLDESESEDRRDEAATGGEDWRFEPKRPPRRVGEVAGGGVVVLVFRPKRPVDWVVSGAGST
jgi:hypothetical protein